jgi:anthranilate synthase component 1
MLAEMTSERTDIHPSLDEVLASASQGNLIPITRELPADLDTPVSVYLKLAGHGASFLLESVEGGEQVGRYSFIGIEPNAVLSFNGRSYTRRSNSHATTADLPKGKDPLHVLQEELARFTPVALPGLPRFVGGLVGYLGYDVIRFFEPKLDVLADASRDNPRHGKPDCPPSERSGGGRQAGAQSLPEALYMLTDTLVAFDHARGRLLIIVNAHLNGDPEAAYYAAVERIDRIADRLSAPLSSRTTQHAPSSTTLSSNFTQAGFEDIVRAAKEHIAAGDIFQVVLSQRLSRRTTAQPFDIYRALRRLNPSPYMFFFDFGTIDEKPYHVIGASPEMLVRLEGRTATLRPIAGTRRRGSHPAEDVALEQELLADPKERAEHVMLLDLGRNDLGRVSEYGTIHIPDLFVVERYSHVMHIVSQVEGTLRDGIDAFDLLRATFPAGTVSGAPKVRAMEIIHDLEQLDRGLYAGSVGYFSYDGAMDTCIAIRTMQMLGDVVSIQAGAGIVADSDPASEYQETLNKAKALAVAIELAEK